RDEAPAEGEAAEEDEEAGEQAPGAAAMAPAQGDQLDQQRQNDAPRHAGQEEGAIAPTQEGVAQPRAGGKPLGGEHGQFGGQGEGFGLVDGGDGSLVVVAGGGEDEADRGGAGGESAADEGGAEQKPVFGPQRHGGG